MPCGGRKKSPPYIIIVQVIFFSLWIIEPILVTLEIEHRLAGARGVCGLANYNVTYEETQSNRVSDFRDFVCCLFPKTIFFYFYFSVSMIRLFSDFTIANIVIYEKSYFYVCGNIIYVQREQ